MSSERVPDNRHPYGHSTRQILKMPNCEFQKTESTGPLEEEILPFNSDPTSFSHSDQLLDTAKGVLYQESQAIAFQAKILDGTFCTAFSLIFNCSGNVIVSGMGKAGLIGQKIAATFASTGTPSHFLHPAEAIHGDLGRIRKNDVVLILSNSGETEEILKIIPSLKEFGTPIISMTKRDSSLARSSNVTLELAVENEAGPLNLAPSNSTAVMLALGDALAFAVSGRRAFREEDFARFHPGGSLGMKLASVEDYMRPLSECRIAQVGISVQAALKVSDIPGRRTGAIFIVNPDFTLAGIYTDSDFTKLIAEKGADALNLPISEVMIRTPKSVRSGDKMSKAVALFEATKISQLPVLDRENKPIGILDKTDLRMN